LYYLLEDSFRVQLLNARHLHNVPGRKTDVIDSEWICRMVQHGLVRPSFVPPLPIRQLRDLTRYRTEVVRERVRDIGPFGEAARRRRHLTVRGRRRPFG
jgi:hypothetical protein